MARLGSRSLWAFLAFVALGVLAADTASCTCTGLDYTDGGSYLVDGSDNGDFTFTSVFQCKSNPSLTCSCCV